MKARLLRNRRRYAVIGLLIVLAVLFKLKPAPAAEVTVPPIVVTDVLEIQVAAEQPAGEPFVIEVTGASGEQPVQLVVDGGYNPRRFTVTPNDDIAQFSIPAAQGPESGTLLLTVSQGDRVTSGTTMVIPALAVDPVDTYLGPRTVVADAEHFTMLVTVPQDQWGNPVVAGTDVDYTINRPNGQVASIRKQTKGLLSWINIYSGIATGRSRVGIEVGTAGGIEESFLEVADIPEQYELEIVDQIPLADGAALVRVRTGELKDQYGNALPDGTVVFLDLTGVTGVRHLWGQTIKAVAEFVFEAPAQPGSVSMTATASGVRSEPLAVSFEQAVEDLPLQLLQLENGDVQLLLGQVRTKRNAYVPDGTTATITVDGEVFEILMINGLGTLTVDEVPQVVTVEVLGSEVTVEPR